MASKCSHAKFEPCGKKRQRLKETAGDQQPVIAPAVVVPFLEKHARTIAIVAVLFASARIAATLPGIQSHLR